MYVLKLKIAHAEDALEPVLGMFLPNYSQNMHFANSWEETKIVVSPLFSFNMFSCYDINITLSYNT